MGKITLAYNIIQENGQFFYEVAQAGTGRFRGGPYQTYHEAWRATNEDERVFREIMDMLVSFTLDMPVDKASLVLSGGHRLSLVPALYSWSDLSYRV